MKQSRANKSILIHLKAIMVNLLLTAMILQPLIPILSPLGCQAEETANKSGNVTESSTNITITNSKSTSTTFTNKTTPSQQSGKEASSSSSDTKSEGSTEDNSSKVGALIPVYYLSKDVVSCALKARFGKEKVCEGTEYSDKAEFFVIESKKIAVKTESKGDSGGSEPATTATSDGASVLVACFCNIDTLNKAESLLSGIDKPTSMLRLSFWVMQINGNAMDVEKVTRDISLDMVQSRAKITALFVLLRELVNQALIADTRLFYIKKNDVKDWSLLMAELKSASSEKSGQKCEIFNLLSAESKKTIKDFKNTDQLSPSFESRLLTEFNAIIDCENLSGENYGRQLYLLQLGNRQIINSNFSSIKKFDIKLLEKKNQIEWSRTTF
ncbi:MAG: hypothetical protein LWY06_14170, partial [Firmicutes bacterium]|nr:hypothetical protein [Bacillota bacterium]